jgi:hypothetical protein
MPKVLVRRKHGAVLFQRVRGDPNIGVRQDYSANRKFGADSGVNRRRRRSRLQDLKRFKKFTGRLEAAGRYLRVRLTEQKLAHDVGADYRRVLPQSPRFCPPITAAQQFNDASINENGHGWALEPAWPEDAAATNRPNDLTRSWVRVPKNVLGQGERPSPQFLKRVYA